MITMSIFDIGTIEKINMIHRVIVVETIGATMVLSGSQFSIQGLIVTISD